METHFGCNCKYTKRYRVVSSNEIRTEEWGNFDTLQAAKEKLFELREYSSIHTMFSIVDISTNRTIEWHMGRKGL